MVQCYMKREVLNRFEAHLYEDEKSELTVRKYMHDLQIFAQYAKDKYMDKQLMMQYKVILKEKYALTSANSMLVALNIFLRYIGRDDLCVKQFRIQKNIFCKEESELTKKEYAALVNMAKKKNNNRLALVLQTICGTGIRVSELEFITVEAAHKGEATVTCKGKTRVVFIASTLRKKLLLYANQRGICQGKIFLTRSGRALDRSNLWKEMKALCGRAEVNPHKVFPHNLRHLFARTFYSIEKDIAKLADVLGHSNINTTRIYMISSGAEHRKNVENMHLIL